MWRWKESTGGARGERGDGEKDEKRRKERESIRRKRQKAAPNKSRETNRAEAGENYD